MIQLLNSPISQAWITCLQPNPQARLRLFCFPFAGAGASIFRNWSNQLPSDIEVCAVQLPGREKRLREPLFTQLTPLIDSLIEALLPYLDLPFAFFGHSLGALICFELARQLRRQKYLTPLHLFVSGRRAPQIPPNLQPIHQLPKDLFIEQLRRYNGTPEAVLQNKELIELLLPILRADLAINETYRYKSEAPLDCSISAFGGLQDRKVSCHELELWREHTNSNFSLQMFSGDHFFLKTEFNFLLQQISRHLRN